MIDVENLVFTKIRSAIKSEYPDMLVSSETLDVPASFPCACIVEEDNSIYRNSQVFTGSENHVNLMYSVNVYTNNVSGKKSEAKKIIDIIDNAFRGIGFNRTMKNPIPNRDSSIYRITARYEGIVANGQTIGEDTIYQVYGR